MAGSRTGCGDRCLEGWIDGRTSLRLDQGLGVGIDA